MSKKKRRRAARRSSRQPVRAERKKSKKGCAVDPFDPNSFATGIMAGDKSTSGASAPSDATSVPVKLLVFDMGHVFVRFDWSSVCQGFCDRAGCSRETFREVLAHVGSLGYETGKVNTEVFLREMNAQLGANLTVGEFTTLWNATFEEDPEMASLLQALGKSFPVFLLSNTNENHYAFLQGRFNVARHFKELILSYQVGLAKPDQRIYRLVIERSGFAAAECVFVDDLEVNVQAARAVGMRAIQFVGIDDLKRRLCQMGVAC